MQKIRYEIDPHNRLTALGPYRFRSVIDGTFKLTGRNSLVYHVKKSDDLDVPQQIKFSGTWSLARDHELILTLDKWNNQCEGNRLVFKGDLIDASCNELVFSIETRQGISLLQFSGTWQADKRNRFTFHVTREEGAVDALIFQGTWALNEQNEITYTYARTNSIVLKGYWAISQKNRLSYVLSEELNSGFDFKVSFEEAKKESLSYTLGVGYAPGKKLITLAGTWKIDNKAGLLFEMEYSEGRVKAIVFGASVKGTDGCLLELKLKNESGADLGMELSLTKQFFAGQGEAFIKALSCGKEMSIVGGMGFRW